MKTVVFVLVLFHLFVLSAYASLGENCGSPSEHGGLVSNLKDIDYAINSTKERQDLFKAKITYSGLDISVGTADVYLNIADGKIVDLNIYSKVSALGQNTTIVEKVTLDQLESGQALNYRMDGGDRAVLSIIPNPGFNDQGGSVVFKV